MLKFKKQKEIGIFDEYFDGTDSQRASSFKKLQTADLILYLRQWGAADDPMVKTVVGMN